ncbi:MAG: DUF3754 domain-containing protein [Planctomycetia bacterium]|nr:MAG: DUF3754 domain-containing protein [Planctomycetia bacterium]
MISRYAELAADPTLTTDCHGIDDRFVPVRVSDLAAALSALAREAGESPADCELVIAGMTLLAEQEAAALLRDTGEMYAPFNPDRDTLPRAKYAQMRSLNGYRAMNHRIRYVLEKANFEQLEDVHIDEALRAASAHGLVVRLDPDLVEEFALFVRGRGRVPLVRRSWRHPWRGVPETTAVYRRLVLVARLKDDPNVLVKMFKDIPAADVDALLPHANASMSWLDRTFMISGGVGTLGTTASQVVKFLSTGLLVASRMLWLLLFGCVMLTWRVFNGYRRARVTRDWHRTRHLYYQNVANNFGVISLLVTMISQEEQKEALLAYFAALLGRGHFEHSAQLRESVDELLRRHFGASVQFDLADALETLDRYGLWENREALCPLSPAEAAARLHALWVARISEGYHLAHPRTRRGPAPVPESR